MRPRTKKFGNLCDIAPDRRTGGGCGANQVQEHAHDCAAERHSGCKL